jgi:hypothetical protein
MKKFVYRLKNSVQDFTINFKKKFKKSKEKPKSKRKSFLVGFTTDISIFGVTLFSSALSAIASNIPKDMPKICPTPPNSVLIAFPSQQIIKGLSGAAVTVCSLAVTSGSFALGIAYGLIVAVGILKVQGK